MILSVSRRTDIPNYYGDWFMECIRNAYIESVNPFNPKQVKGIDLSPETIDCIVFWTKNPEPFLKHIPELKDRGYHFYFQVTINNYPKTIEPALPILKRRLVSLERLYRLVGKKCINWRYDPILYTPDINMDYHTTQFCKLAEIIAPKVQGISFALLEEYKKINKACKELGICRVPDKEIPLLYNQLQEICSTYNQNLKACCLPNFPNIPQARCIDEDLIHKLNPVCKEKLIKDKSQRKGCGCIKAIDVGKYGTCASRCVYCYAR